MRKSRFRADRYGYGTVGDIGETGIQIGRPPLLRPFRMASPTTVVVARHEDSALGQHGRSVERC